MYQNKSGSTVVKDSFEALNLTANFLEGEQLRQLEAP
jgi:hypothetical protein